MTVNGLSEYVNRCIFLENQHDNKMNIKLDLVTASLALHLIHYMETCVNGILNEVVLKFLFVHSSSFTLSYYHRKIAHSQMKMFTNEKKINVYNISLPPPHISLSHAFDVIYINMNFATDFYFLVCLLYEWQTYQFIWRPNIIHAVKLWQSLISVTHHIYSMFRCFWNNSRE